MNTIPYKIKRTNRKTVALEVTGSMEVLVRAPLIMPEEEIEELVEKHATWIQKGLEKQKKLQKTRYEPTAEEVNALIEKARNVIPEKINHYGAIMGLWPSAVKITSAKTRFGSCSGKNSICFSWRLMMYPDEAIDYVVVHELAHIRHKNHGKAFYALIQSVMPDYKERAALLNK